jgi:predicted DNA-binding WGR domain protein
MDKPAGSGKAGAFDHLAFRRLVQGTLFWEAALDGSRLILRWGRTGTRGQTKLVSFTDEAAAREEMDKREKEQMAKGYVADQEPR